MTAPDDEAVTVATAASLLKVHENTVRILYTKGQLPYFRIGRAIRLRRSDIEKYMASLVEKANI